MLKKKKKDLEEVSNEGKSMKDLLRHSACLVAIIRSGAADLGSGSVIKMG